MNKKTTYGDIAAGDKELPRSHSQGVGSIKSDGAGDSGASGFPIAGVLLDHFVDPIMVFDPSTGQSVQWNRGFREFSGYNDEEIRALKVPDSYFEDPDLELFRDLIKRIPQDGGGKLELAFKIRDGRKKHIEYQVSLIDTEANAPNFILCLGRDVTARKEIERTLRSSEERLRNLTSNAREMLYRMKLPEGHYEYVSPASEELTGYTPEEFIYAPKLVQAMFHPDWVDYFEEQWGKLIKGEVPPFYEYKIIHRSGRERWMYQSNVLVRDENGQPLAIEGIVRDVTDRKAVEEALRRERDKAQKYLDVAGVMFVVLGRDGTIQLINKKGGEILGLPEKEIMGMNWFDHFVPKHVRSNLKELFKRYIDGDLELIEYHENDILTNSGEERVLAWHNTVLRDEQGNIIGSLSSGEDITQRRRAQERLDQFFKVSLDMLCVADLEGYLRYINPAFEKTLGYSSEELLSKPYLEFVHPEDRDQTIAAAEQLTRGEGVVDFENRYRCKDGTYKWMKWSAMPDTKQGVCYSVARDVTSEKAATRRRQLLEAQLQQAQKMEAIGTLAGGIAHDFNNILTAVLGYTEIAMSEAAADSPQIKNLQQVLKAGNRAKDLVHQILTFSRQSEQEMKPIRIGLIVSEAAKLLRASLPSNIEIRKRVESKAAVLADPTQIHQVLMNICTNAGHAMQDQGGVMEILLEDILIDADFKDKHPDLTVGQHVQLTVSDTGKGISPSIQERIFDPFFTTKDKGEGTGMGLAVVHGIVQSHNGAIAVESVPGEGSVFRIYLPVIETDLISESLSDKTVPRGDECILVIDDEAPIVDMIMKALRSLGYEVVGKTDSSEALALFNEQRDRFDLVITDLTMPRMTGEVLAKKIMGIRPDIPVILSTGYSAKVDEKRAMALGIRAFLNKPVALHELAATIRTVLDG